MYPSSKGPIESIWKEWWGKVFVFYLSAVWNCAALAVRHRPVASRFLVFFCAFSEQLGAVTSCPHTSLSVKEDDFYKIHRYFKTDWKALSIGGWQAGWARCQRSNPSDPAAVARLINNFFSDKKTPVLSFMQPNPFTSFQLFGDGYGLSHHLDRTPSPPKIFWFFNQHSAFFQSSGRAWSQLGSFPSTVNCKCWNIKKNKPHAQVKLLFTSMPDPPDTPSVVVRWWFTYI